MVGPELTGKRKKCAGCGKTFKKTDWESWTYCPDCATPVKYAEEKELEEPNISVEDVKELASKKSDMNVKERESEVYSISTVAVDSIFTIIATEYLTAKANAAVQVRPELAEVGFVTALLTAHATDWIFYHIPWVGATIIFLVALIPSMYIASMAEVASMIDSR